MAIAGVATDMASPARAGGGRPRVGAALLGLALLLLSVGPARAEPEVSADGRPDDLIGQRTRIIAAEEDTFASLMRRHGVGYVALVAANPGINPWTPGGSKIEIPTQHVLPHAPRRGIVVNLAELRLYWFPPDGGPPRSFPIGIGREGMSTPLGETRVTRKREQPTWYPPASLRQEKPWLPRAVPPGPDNPLGDHALSLGWPAYVIHGTNRPDGIGRRVSHGCVRMYPRDIENLFSGVAVGTPVRVVEQPVKFGWRDGALFVEAHPLGAEIDELEATGRIAAPTPLPFWTQLRAAAGDALDRVDAEVLFQALRERRGVPVRITAPAEPLLAAVAVRATASGALARY